MLTERAILPPVEPSQLVGERATMAIGTRATQGPYMGYYQSEEPAEDAELAHVGPGTPCGEYLRRFWQPVAFSHELADLPVRLRILGEDPVLFPALGGRTRPLHLPLPPPRAPPDVRPVAPAAAPGGSAAASPRAAGAAATPRGCPPSAAPSGRRGGSPRIAL